MPCKIFAQVTVIAWLALGVSTSFADDGAKVVNFYGYDDCIRLFNDQVRVTLCPAAGGRVLEYALDGQNVLYLPPGDEGWRSVQGRAGGQMNAGRFDIGPERMVRRGDVLWKGPWKGSITGARSARLVSQVDPESGVRLLRDFRLDQHDSRLRCTQTIDNVSDQSVNLCHWSRTFAVGRGFAIIPRTPRGRFPAGYAMYDSGTLIDFNPNDPHVFVSEDYVTVVGPPKKPKLGFDSHAGWLAYSAPNDLLFIKGFKTFPNRAYNEMAGLTISIWYPAGDMCELEPIGPAEELEPGESASFTETWWLVAHDFAKVPERIKYEEIRETVSRLSLR